MKRRTFIQAIGAVLVIPVAGKVVIQENKDEACAKLMGQVIKHNTGIVFNVG